VQEGNRGNVRGKEVNKSSRAAHPRKALEGRKPIPQGNALGNGRQKKSARGLDARAKVDGRGAKARGAIPSERSAAPRKSERRPSLKSDLGNKIWAVLHDDGPVGNLTHPEAMELAAKNGGYVTTNDAILNCD
jgi:hypothetical protein